jgi:type IV secretory pathway VirB2 component (pilin)
VFISKGGARHQNVTEHHPRRLLITGPKLDIAGGLPLHAKIIRFGTRALLRNRFRSPSLLALIFALAVGSPLLADSPWETAVTNLQTSFTGPIAKGLSLVALVVGGLMFAYSESGSKKVFAGIVFGLGMALGAANFMAWLFP